MVTAGIMATIAFAQQVWQPQPGWKIDRSQIALAGYGERRLTGPVAPANFSWRAKLTLKAGRSAGILFGLSDDGVNGYVARLDSRLSELILAKIGPWPTEDRTATFHWEPVDGATLTLRVVAGAGTARIYVEERGKYPLLEARHIHLPGNRVGLYGIDADADFHLESPVLFQAPEIVAHVPKVGSFTHIYDQSPTPSEQWYINDHCFIHGSDGWHLYGITHAQPANPMDERNFAHATSPSLLKTPWTKQPFALTYDPNLGEDHLWAPHVIEKDHVYYMFYCAGSKSGSFHYRLHLATSTDLVHWKRYEKNPLFEDYYDARDPMCLLVGDTYYLYYTGNLDAPTGNHIVNVRTSKDLLHWSPARVALVHPEVGTYGGPTESPFVVHVGDHFYLFVGPDGDYHATKVYRSPNPYAWSYQDQIYGFPSHACEVVQDLDGKYYSSDSGWDLKGVYLAPLEWLTEPKAPTSPKK